MTHRLFLTAAAILLLPILLLRGSGSAAQALSTLPREIEAGSPLNHFFEVAVVNEPIRIILVNKDMQKIQVLEHNGRLKIIAEYPCATGENPGKKLKTGDACTPEGVYFITKIFKDTKISVFGNRAFHLDYPNIFDAMDGRDGDGIYIHGTNKKLVPFSSNGCITMINDDLDHLVSYMDKEVTPVVIFNTLDQLQPQAGINLSSSDFKLAKLMLPPEEINPDKLSYDYLYIIHFGSQAVVVGEFANFQDINARNRGHSRAYLDYNATDGWQMRKRLWHATPFIIYADNPGKLLVHKPYIEEIDIPPQTSSALLLARNNETEVNSSAMEYQSPEVKTAEVNTSAPAETKQLTALVASAGKVEEVDTVNNNEEEPPKVPTPPAEIKVPQPETAPSIAQVAQILTPRSVKISPFNHKDIIDFIEAWRLAWQSKELDTYISYYDKSFQQGSKNLTAWKKHKERLNQLYAKIIVDISDITIRLTTEGAVVSFHQVYQSDKYNAKGRKTLILVKRNEDWGIQQELWAKSES